MTKTYRRKRNNKKTLKRKGGSPVKHLTETQIQNVLSRVEHHATAEEMDKLRDYFNEFTIKRGYSFYYSGNKEERPKLLGQALDIAERWIRDGDDALV
jgi:hypothetical protein